MTPQGGGAKREPSAVLRTMAASLHELYVALVDAGFREEQALVLMQKMVAESMRNDRRRGDDDS